MVLPMKVFRLIFLLVLPILLASGPEHEERAVVLHVYDGDTILAGKKRVRLLGIDTPERNPKKSNLKAECYAEKATGYLKRKILHKVVRLVPDPQADRKDKYGRYLYYVYLKDNLINADLIKKGYAFTFASWPYSKKEEFFSLQKEAKTNQRGLWKACEVRCKEKICKVKP